MRTGRRSTSRRAVAHDREEPWLERHLAVVGAQGGQRADEGVLDDLLGVVVGAAEHLRAKREQALVVAVVDRVEGAVVACAHEVDELLVRGGPVGGGVQEDRHGSRFGPRGPRSQPPWGPLAHPRWGIHHPGSLDSPVPSPLQAHSATPAELRERIEAERRGRPFLVLRDGDGAQRLLDLAALRARQRRPRPGQRAEPALGHGGLAAARRARGRSRGSGRSATTASRATARSSTARASRAARGCATATSCASARR